MPLDLEAWRVAPTLTWHASLIAAFIGTLSHVALDSIMHQDMRPLWPFAENNPLLSLISVRDLHLACVLSGIVGLATLAWQAQKRRKPR